MTDEKIEEKTEDTTEKMTLNEKVQQSLIENRRSLYIGRIPEKYKEQFIKWAEEAYVGDYGMLLVHLLDTAMVADAKYSTLNDKIESVINWVTQIESRLNILSKGDEKKEIKMVGGKVIKRPEAIERMKDEVK